jgi:hypothetical protein
MVYGTGDQATYQGLRKHGHVKRDVVREEVQATRGEQPRGKGGELKEVKART